MNPGSSGLTARSRSSGPGQGHSNARTRPPCGAPPDGHCNDRDHLCACARATSLTSQGYQAHHRLDPLLEAAIDAEAARLHAIEDPLQAVQAVNEFYSQSASCGHRGIGMACRAGRPGIFIILMAE